MRIAVNCVSSMNDFQFEDKFNSFRNNYCNDTFIKTYHIVPEKNYVDKYFSICKWLKNNNIDNTKIIYYGILFMYSEFNDKNILPLINDYYTTDIFDTKKISNSKEIIVNEGIDINVDKDTKALLNELGNLPIFKEGFFKDGITTAFNIMMRCIDYDRNAFVKFINKKRILNVFTLNIYQSLRWKKMREYYTVQNLSLSTVFDLYCCADKLPSANDFKVLLDSIINDTIGITDLLGRWKKQHKTLLSCYIGEDEKRYLEYLLLSNRINYKDLEKYVYSK